MVIGGRLTSNSIASNRATTPCHDPPPEPYPKKRKLLLLLLLLYALAGVLLCAMSSWATFPRSSMIASPLGAPFQHFVRLTLRRDLPTPTWAHSMTAIGTLNSGSDVHRVNLGTANASLCGRLKAALSSVRNAQVVYPTTTCQWHGSESMSEWVLDLA